jgi:hypothetical protein
MYFEYSFNFLEVKIHMSNTAWVEDVRCTIDTIATEPSTLRMGSVGIELKISTIMLHQ